MVQSPTPPRSLKGKGRSGQKLRPRKGRGREYVYEVLKQRIVALDLAPGAELDEVAIVRELGVSRTPLREALVKLSADGLVKLMPNRGARVAPMDLAYVQEHLEAFDLMQRIATCWAAVRRSKEDLARIEELMQVFEEAERRHDSLAMTDANFRFHEAIGLACGNNTIAKVYIRLLSEGLRVARLAMAYESYGSREAFEDHVRKIVDEHRLIVEAIRNRDADKAEILATSHSGLARKRVLEYLSVSFVDGLPIGAPMPDAA